MTITLADRRDVPEASRRPNRLSFTKSKVAEETESPLGQTLAVDEAEGIVTAIVSVTGIEDEVDDIIVPGAYRETLIKRRPKVCWAHKWDAPIGRVLYIEELQPGDDRLPVKQRNGDAWPAAAGALVATMQFNMRSVEGKQAFEAVAFFTETGECEYSIGYQVPPGKSTRDKKGTRHIKALDLYELSVVLFGAHTMTGTLSIKEAVAQVMERKTLGRQMRTEKATAATRLAEAKAGLDSGDGLLRPSDAAPDDEKDTPPDFSDGVMVALYPDAGAADQVYSQISGPDNVLPRDELHLTLAFLGSVGDVGPDSEAIVRTVTQAVEGFPALEGEIAGLGVFPDNGDGAPTWAPVDVPGLGIMREAIVEALGDDVDDTHGFTPHITLGYDLGLITPIDPVPVEFTSVRVVYGNQQTDITLGAPIEGEPKSLRAVDGAFAIVKPGVGRVGAIDWSAKDGEGGMDTFLMDFSDTDWQALEAELDTAEIKALLDEIEGKAVSPGGRAADDSPVGTPGGTQNWVDKAGGLPKYIRMVAHALIRNGKSKASAIAIAVATMKRWAANVGGKVSAKVQAAAAKALAEWEKMKGEAHAKATAYDPALDVITETKGIEMAPGQGFPQLPGTYEERLAMVRATVSEAFRGEPVDEDGDKYEWNYVDLQGTWPDRLILTRVKWQNSGPDIRESYEMDYTYTPDGITLGDPEPVTLQIVAITDDGEEDYPAADAADLAGSVDQIAYTVKSSHPTTIEGKAGRVLSGRNERALTDALARLLDVLRAAGVRVPTGDDEPAQPEKFDDSGLTSSNDQRREMDPAVDLESTSPSANRSKKSVLQGGEMPSIAEARAEILAMLAEVDDD